MNAITYYIEILKGLLELYHREDESIKPELIYRAKLIARAAIIVSLFCKNKDKSIIDTVSGAMWLEQVVGGNCYIAELIINLTSQEQQIINFLLDDLVISEMGETYEQMLSIDTVGFEIITGKGLRNQLGSYY